jgi:hypothetical protein
MKNYIVGSISRPCEFKLLGLLFGDVYVAVVLTGYVYNLGHTWGEIEEKIV